MTDQQRDKIIELSKAPMALLENIPVEDRPVKIVSNSAYWMGLSQVYSMLVGDKDIEPLSSLTLEQKRAYWNIAKQTPDKAQWVYTMMCQALYVYELILNNS